MRAAEEIMAQDERARELAAEKEAEAAAAAADLVELTARCAELEGMVVREKEINQKTDEGFSAALQAQAGEIARGERISPTASPINVSASTRLGMPSLFSR